MAARHGLLHLVLRAACRIAYIHTVTYQPAQPLDAGGLCAARGELEVGLGKLEALYRFAVDNVFP